MIVRLPSRRAPEAVLFDRDGTLVVEVSYNGDRHGCVRSWGGQVVVARTPMAARTRS